MNIKNCDNNFTIKEDALNEVVTLILSRSIEVNVVGNNKVPKIFYIGIGKTGSSSILKYINETVAHWHNENYFETIYNTDILTKHNISLYDIALFIGKKYQFKPLIVESYREPVARAISGIAHRNRVSKTPTNNYKELSLKLSDNYIESVIEPYSLRWKKCFNVDLLQEFSSKKNFFHKELDSAQLLFLKLENIKSWPLVFQRIGFNYQNIKSNDALLSKNSALYKALLENFKLTLPLLESIYSNRVLTSLYSTEDIDSFKERWANL